MIATQDGRPQPELEQVIQHGIARRTRVGIQTLEVVVTGSRIVIRGHVQSYCLKQLVLQGVLDAVGPAGASGVEFNVQVAVGSAEPTESAE